MKQVNKVRRLKMRRVGYDLIMENLKNDVARAKGYHRPGSMAK